MQYWFRCEQAKSYMRFAVYFMLRLHYSCLRCNHKNYDLIEQMGENISDDIVMLAKGTSLRTAFLAICNLVRYISMLRYNFRRARSDTLTVWLLLTEDNWGTRFGFALGWANSHDFATRRTDRQTERNRCAISYDCICSTCPQLKAWKWNIRTPQSSQDFGHTSRSCVSFFVGKVRGASLHRWKFEPARFRGHLKRSCRYRNSSRKTYACISWKLKHVWAKIRKLCSVFCAPISELRNRSLNLKTKRIPIKRLTEGVGTELWATILGTKKVFGKMMLAFSGKKTCDGSFLWQDAKGTWLPLVEEPAAGEPEKKTTSV